MGDQIKRVALEFDVFRHADGAQTSHDLVRGQTMEVEALAARMDGFRHLLGIGGAQDEDHMRGRLFKRLQQRVECSCRKHVHFVDDIDLHLAARGGEIDATDNLITHIFNARAACGVNS